MKKILSQNQTASGVQKANNEQGFTLLELLVSMSIFLIVISSVYGLLQVSLIDRNRSSRRTDILKNARAALHLIGRDTLNAGLGFNKSGAVVPDNFISTKLGLPTDADTQRDILTGIIGGNNLFINILQPDSNAKTDIIAFAYRDVEFNPPIDPLTSLPKPGVPGDVISLNNAAAAPSAPATVRLQTTTGGATNTRVNDLYLVESDSSQVLVMATNIPSGAANIDIAPADPLALNQALNGTGTSVSLLQKCTATITQNCTSYVASVKRINWITYKVKSDGTLIRTIYGNNGNSTTQIQEMPLAYNVQDLQFKYILENGKVTDDPAAGPDNIRGTTDDTPSDFNLVRQIIVTIKVQAPENDEQTKAPETITLTSTFCTRNLEYDAG